MGRRSPSNYDFRRNSKSHEIESILNNMSYSFKSTDPEKERDAFSQRLVLLITNLIGKENFNNVSLISV